MVKKGAGGGMNVQFLADLLDIQSIKGLQRAVRLAMGRTESGEVMVAD